MLTLWSVCFRSSRVLWQLRRGAGPLRRPPTGMPGISEPALQARQGEEVRLQGQSTRCTGGILKLPASTSDAGM
ncbi:hypothetical protein D3C76_1826700 [compost metagenome]